MGGLVPMIRKKSGELGEKRENLRAHGTHLAPTRCPELAFSQRCKPRGPSPKPLNSHFVAESLDARGVHLDGGRCIPSLRNDLLPRPLLEPCHAFGNPLLNHRIIMIAARHGFERDIAVVTLEQFFKRPRGFDFDHVVIDGRE